MTLRRAVKPLRFGCRAAPYFTGFAVAVVLSGCVGSAAWTKPGMSEAQLSEDLGICLDETRQQTQRNYAIDTDIQATRGNDWRRASEYQAKSDDLTGSDATKSDRILGACMAGRGYQPAS